MIKKTLFILWLGIGIPVISFILNYYSATSNILESIALYASLSTACYAILAEPKQRTEPLLRITPLVKQQENPISFHYRIDVWIENIGYGIAKNIEIKIKASDPKVNFNNNGYFKHLLLIPKERFKCPVLEFMDSETYTNQRLIVEISYSNEDDKKLKPIHEEYTIRELKEGFSEEKTG